MIVRTVKRRTRFSTPAAAVGARGSSARSKTELELRAGVGTKGSLTGYVLSSARRLLVVSIERWG